MRLTGDNVPRLAHSLNKTIVAAIPAFFGTDDPRSCILVDIETTGLWLAGDAVRDRACNPDGSEAPLVVDAPAFIPFAQILFLIDPAPRSAIAQILGPGSAGARPGPASSKQPASKKRPPRPRAPASKTAPKIKKRK